MRVTGPLQLLVRVMFWVKNLHLRKRRLLDELGALNTAELRSQLLPARERLDEQTKLATSLQEEVRTVTAMEIENDGRVASIAAVNHSSRLVAKAAKHASTS